MQKLSKRQIDQFWRWRERLIQVGSDIGNLLLGRYIFRESQRVISKNPKLKGIFARWLAINYTNNAVLGIRRAVDTDRQAVSLASLMREMIANPKVITRSMIFVAPELRMQTRIARRRRWGAGFVNFLERKLLDEFFTEIAIPGSGYLNVRLIGQDLNLIRRKAKNAERFATKRVAHYDEVPPVRVTYNEIDEALDTFDSLMSKYFKLFGLRGWTSGAEFEALFPGWKEIFEIPWK